MSEFEKLYRHHYQYKGSTVVLAEGTYDEDDDSSILAKLQEVSAEAEEPSQ